MANKRIRKKQLQKARLMIRNSEEKKSKDNCVREASGCMLRAVEDKERVFQLSFSSEEPYMRWFGNEILDHSDGCVDLSRLEEIGVVLFNHDRDKILGKVLSVAVENGRGIAEIEFDSDDESEKIYQKVKSGTLKGVSVGYKVDVWEEVEGNKVSTDGRFTGPVSIAKRWCPYEISIVSVPADPTVGVGREMEEQKPEINEYEIRSRQFQINKNLLGGISL